MDADDLLRMLGARTRALRTARGWTLRDLSERCGLSPRFLVQLEAGRANISVRRLADLAATLETTSAGLLAEQATNGGRSRIVAFLGLRGAGKTTIGRRLARRLHVPFVELDRRIEQAADLSLGELFTLYGEDYYRKLERDTLDRVLADDGPLVLATGGGIVTAPETYARLRRSTLTIWLRATPEDHWNRVVRQGDRRPMADHPQAMAALRALLAARAPLYATAEYTVDTSGRSVADIVEEISARVRPVVAATA